MALVSEWVSCYICQGTGEDPDYPSSPCFKCEGRGQVLDWYDDDEEEDQ